MVWWLDQEASLMPTCGSALGISQLRGDTGAEPETVSGATDPIWLNDPSSHWRSGCYLDSTGENTWFYWLEEKKILQSQPSAAAAVYYYCYYYE